MEWFEALVLGLIQGLTEFIPVSSSAHLEITKNLFGFSGEENLYFSVLVHGGTVLSTLVVFRKEIIQLAAGAFKFKYNEETDYILKIAVSTIPVFIIGIFFKDYIESFFDGESLVFVGSMLLITALILTFTFFYKPKRQRKINFIDAFVIGISQAIAVLPGISRSGATISTGLILGNNKSEVAQFSFLMVLIPILGENFLSIISKTYDSASIPMSSLIIGFLASFLSGLFACKVMLNIVRKGKLIWFAIYCAIVGLISIFVLG